MDRRESIVHLRRGNQLTTAGLYISRWRKDGYETGPGQSVPVLTTYFSFCNSFHSYARVPPEIQESLKISQWLWRQLKRRSWPKGYGSLSRGHFYICYLEVPFWLSLYYLLLTYSLAQRSLRALKLPKMFVWDAWSQAPFHSSGFTDVECWELGFLTGSQEIQMQAVLGATLREIPLWSVRHGWLQL